MRKTLISTFLLFLFFCKKENASIGSHIFVVEREKQQLAVFDFHKSTFLKRISLNADLRHATMVFDPQLNYGYIATRNGKLNRIALNTGEFAGFIETSKNSIGLAIREDGKVIAVSEYEPGGITLIDTENFTIIQKIEAFTEKDGKKISSRVTGLVDSFDNTFVCALMDASEIWVLEPDEGLKYKIKKKIQTQAPAPFDALITTEGRYYLTGHFQSTKISLVDLWNLTDNAKSVDLEKNIPPGIPVKMPHMEAWATASGKMFVPIPAVKKLYVLSGDKFEVSASIDLIGDPVYTVLHPNNKEIWVTFSGENDGKIQVIDTRSEKSVEIIDAGKRIYHLAFTPRGDRVFASSNQTNELLMFDGITRKVLNRFPVESPSGIFGVWRAFQIGL